MFSEDSQWLDADDLHAPRWASKAQVGDLKERKA